MSGTEESCRVADKQLCLTILFRGHPEAISLPSSSTVNELQEIMYEKTNVPPSLQKLLYKGKKINSAPEMSLEEAGLKDAGKVQMLGSTERQLEDMAKAENERLRRENVLRMRTQKKAPTVRRTTRSSVVNVPDSHEFSAIQPLNHLPSPGAATAYLKKLASDPAVRHVMQRHQFSVQTLTELAPHEQPHLLGLNVNQGEVIKLRIRTDEYDGFRPYLEVRRVLCHELAHNVWGDHDDNFKQLNSQLNREVSEFERAAREGAHRLGGDAAIYQPELDVEHDAHEYILGTIDGQHRDHLINSAEDRRRRALEAAISRLRLEESELENSCGTAGPQASTETAPLTLVTRKSSKVRGSGFGDESAENNPT